MRRLVYSLAIAACLGAGSVFLTPAPAQADDYWDGYWSWYDGSYRPYYYRQRVYGPSYGYYPYDGYYYGPRYSGNYYGTRDLGYRDFPGSGGQLRVGPLRFGWR
jgi:hypothetical protein